MNMPFRQNLIIDTDPGVDDAIALMYPIKSQIFNIQLITSAGGNGPIENITANAIHITDLFGANIPVAQGAAKPYAREAKFALGAQGELGLGNYAYDKEKLSRKPIAEEACDAIYNTLKQNEEKTTIISMGPMTNIALLLEKYPDSKNHIKEIIFESGTKEKIIGKPYKSFNVGYDPEAAEIVFKSGVPLVMVPMDLGHIAYLDKNDIEMFKRTNKTGKIYAEMFDGYRDFHVGKTGAAVHDVCILFYLTHPYIFKTEQAFIDIKYYQTEDSNFGYVDSDFEKTPNATMCVDMNIDDFKQELFRILETCE